MSAVAQQSFTAEEPAAVGFKTDGDSTSIAPATAAILESSLPTAGARDGRHAYVRPTQTHASASVALEPMQEWEGVVDWVENGEFGARLFDLTSASAEAEETEFSFDEVSRDDLGLVVPGAVFYWTIAREINESRRLRHITMLRFRRLPAGRSARRVDVEQEAEWLSEQLRFGERPAESDAASA